MSVLNVTLNLFGLQQVSCPSGLCTALETLFSFISMGGYGAYVWSAYGLTAMVLVLNFYLPKRRWRRQLNGGVE